MISSLPPDEIAALAGRKAVVPRGTELSLALHPADRSELVRIVQRRTIVTICSALPYGAGVDESEPAVCWLGRGGYPKQAPLAAVTVL